VPSSRTDQKASSVFELAFPVDLNHKQVLAWVHTLSGLLTSGPGRMFGVRYVVLELWATDQGLRYRLAAPSVYADYLANQLRTHLPGIRVTPVRDEPAVDWTVAVELGTRRYNQTLSVPDAASVSTSLLAGLRDIQKGESCLLQWVVTPALHERPPAAQSRSRGGGSGLFGKQALALPQPAADRILDQREKLTGANFQAVLRVGVRAATEPRAQHLLRSVRTVLSSTRSMDNSFQQRPMLGSVAKRHLANRNAPLLYPAQLSVDYSPRTIYQT
jgi:hypothetical protein